MYVTGVRFLRRKCNVEDTSGHISKMESSVIYLALVLENKLLYDDEKLCRLREESYLLQSIRVRSRIDSRS